ncbi:lebercilin-like protein [Trematomus bernacchii]|uniref:lebercilin-like protein n=1 Tax=Trematomus bernacchii TaxID=40690 RepID=UPI00146BA6BA|nr:lebercilin-like protein [Trematomus bernacchii]
MMCVRQQSLMQQVLLALREEGDGDALSCSTDCEEKADSLTYKSQEVNTSNERRRQKGNKEPQKQKTNQNANRHVLKLPPIKTPQVLQPRIQSASSTCIRDLKSRVVDLQQQLSAARTETRLLKNLQHRHTVALQHFQESESSVSQILAKHSNEARVLQQLLSETRACRDSLARQLQSTEINLHSTKASLQHLQLLSQDHSLLPREELSLRLDRASAQLESKDRRIQDLEKNLELSQASFNRQIFAEQRKINEAKKITGYLQEQIYHLNKEIQDRERELETHNIYSQRFLKGSPKKGSKSKMVQTDPLVCLSSEAGTLLELKYTEKQGPYNPVEESLAVDNPETGLSADLTLEENHPEETETCAQNQKSKCSANLTLEENQPEECADEQSSADEGTAYLSEGDYAEEEEAPEASAEERKTEETSYILGKSLNANGADRQGYTLPKIRSSYTFKQTIENMHIGKPAYSIFSAYQSPMKMETLSGEGGPELCLPAGKSRKGVAGSPQGK